MRPGYAVEYEYCRRPSSAIRWKQRSRLYFAGQINGNSGYESRSQAW